jgi:hypothetical protein
MGETEQDGDSAWGEDEWRPSSPGEAAAMLARLVQLYGEYRESVVKANTLDFWARKMACEAAEGELEGRDTAWLRAWAETLYERAQDVESKAERPRVSGKGVVSYPAWVKVLERWMPERPRDVMRLYATAEYTVTLPESVAEAAGTGDRWMVVGAPSRALVPDALALAMGFASWGDVVSWIDPDPTALYVTPSVPDEVAQPDGAAQRAFREGWTTCARGHPGAPVNPHDGGRAACWSEGYSRAQTEKQSVAEILGHPVEGEHEAPNENGSE